MTGGYIRVGEISWLVRSDLRHYLQGLHGDVLQMRTDLVTGEEREFRARGLVEKLDSWIGSLKIHRARILGEIETGEREREREKKREKEDPANI